MRPVTDGRGDGWDLWEGICDLIDWNAEGCRLAQTFILDQEDVLTIDLIWGPEKNQDSVSEEYPEMIAWSFNYNSACLGKFKKNVGRVQGNTRRKNPGFVMCSVC